MLKILSAARIRELDAYTIQHNPIRSIDLMEKACLAFSLWLAEKFEHSCNIGIVCGTGNNGGDGLGIARILSGWGYTVKVWIIREGKETPDFIVNRERLPPDIGVKEFSSTEASDFSTCQVLIDAIFGSGLSRPAEGIFKEAIEAINRTESIRVAVDIPSGLFADKHSSGTIIRAHHTVTFQLPKLAFLMPENNPFTGEWHVVDIGLNKSFIAEVKSPSFYLTKKSVKDILKTRGTFSHKGDYGKALIIAGSYGKMGAAVLASGGALRSGVGLLTTHIPKSGYNILQSTVPEAMVSADGHDEIFSDGPNDLSPFDVIGIGPGLGVADETVAAFKKILKAGKPLIIDADALNILSVHRELLHLVPKESILTPHPKEFERLVEKWTDDFERLEKQKKLAAELKSVIILKGAHTSISAPSGEVYFNSTGNPGMATGGTGDVLTGILTGLRAQQYTFLEASILGVYLHGLAGDLAAREKGMDALIASDLIQFLPEAFKALHR